MKNDVSTFLQEQLLTYFKLPPGCTKPLLLAYSGGIDSQALFHLLLELQAKIPINLHVAHVDHKWRSSSSVEACLLKDYVEKFNIPFHLVTLDKQKQPLSDLENYFRNERLKAFQNIYKAIDAGCLMMAHHQDDQVETVFKRFFEGGAFIKLSGLKRQSHLHGMHIVRPLLGCEKKHLIKYLEIKQLSHIEDITNSDTTHLRARQRQLIFPQIEAFFGKNAKKNLSRIANKAAELELYLDSQTQKYTKYILKGPFGISVDFSKEPFFSIECEHVIKKLLALYNTSVPCLVLEDIIGKIEKGLASKRFPLNGLEIFVDRGHLFIHPGFSAQRFPEKITWEGKESSFETADFSWSLLPTSCKAKETSWRDLYIGEVLLELEEGEYILKEATQDRKALEKGFSSSRVPGFLRSLAPVFLKNGEVISNPWIKTSKKIKEKKAVKLVCRAKNRERLNFHSLKSTPLLSSKS